MIVNESKLHPRNKHKKAYNFNDLISVVPELEAYVKTNEFGTETIDFFNPKAVRLLNKSLLKFHYSVEYWELPNNYLTPPIPGRVDYLHYLADLSESNAKNIMVLDVGTGANLIYPILGVKEYGWSFVASEIDDKAIENSLKIIRNNTGFAEKIEIRKQIDSNSIFRNIIKKEERFSFAMCNPPFHSSAEDALKSAKMKISNLKNKKVNKPLLNFSGNSNELWCNGGEEQFTRQMIYESKDFSKNVEWFSSLVSKESLIGLFIKILKKVNVREYRIIEMSQGNKNSRILAWRF